MTGLLQRDTVLTPYAGVDERLARAELRRQIGRLERQLAGLFAEAFLRTEIESAVPASGGPRVLGLGELARDCLGEPRIRGRRGELGRGRDGSQTKG